MRFACFALGLIAALAVGPRPATAFEIEEHIVYAGTEADNVLRVISTADRSVFEPILLAFQAENPGVTIDYTITSTSHLMRAIYDEEAAFDLAISSAMDLQTKLVNDGFARAYRSDATDALPDWAKWRNQLFAFTQEPAVFVVSEADFDPGTVPQTREALIELLRDAPEQFRGRIGIYDVAASGFGYLIATQESRNSDSYWRLTEVMGRLDAKLYCCSGDMIRDVASGRLAIAYNVLGSYAETEARTVEGFSIVTPTDFVHVMLRTVLIPRTVENEDAAQAMVDFLTSLQNRPSLVEASGFPAIDAAALEENNALRPIRFGPGLLVFLDRLKRETFLRSWQSSITQQ